MASEEVSLRDQLSAQEKKYKECLSMVTKAESEVNRAKSDCLECLQLLTSLQNTYLLDANKQLAGQNEKLIEELKKRDGAGAKMSADEAVQQVRAENLS